MLSIHVFMALSDKQPLVFKRKKNQRRKTSGQSKFVAGTRSPFRDLYTRTHHLLSVATLSNASIQNSRIALLLFLGSKDVMASKDSSCPMIPSATPDPVKHLYTIMNSVEVSIRFYSAIVHSIPARNNTIAIRISIFLFPAM